MSTLNWDSFSTEIYLIAGLSVLCIIMLIILLSIRRKNKVLKRIRIADQIDLEESGRLEKWFNVFTTTIPQVFWIRSERETLFVSPHFEKLTGHPVSLINHFPHGLLKICHPADLEMVRAAHEKMLVNKTDSLDINYRIQKSGSHYVWIRERLFVHKYMSGEKFFVGLMEDVTEKMTYIEEISDQKVLLDNILASTDEGIYCLDRNFCCVFWNNEMTGISGLAKDTVIGHKSIFDHLPHLLNNGVADVIRATLQGETHKAAVYTYHLGNSRKGFTNEKYLPLHNSKGETIGVLGIVKDITEEMARDAILEKTQEQYGLTLKALNDGIWDWDLRTNNLIFSDQWFEMLGYSPDELSSSYATLLNLITTDEGKNQLQNSLELLKKGDAISLELKMKHKSGADRWMLIRGKCIETNDAGVSVRAIGTQTDITQRKLNELELVKAKTMAEESDRLKSAFLSNMSHEIRTPLNAIIGFTDLLTNDDMVSREDKESFRFQIRKNSEHLLKLINDIILLSMLESGQIQKREEVVDLTEMIKSTALAVYRNFGKEKAAKVSLLVKIPPGMHSLALTTDKTLIEKCLYNLIENGLAYTEEGTVSVGFDPPRNQSVRLFVSDTGQGIKAEDQNKIFRQFVQLDSGLSRRHEGSGLGLSLVNRIMTQLNGSITLESVVGEGSSFFITLPYQTPSDMP